LLKAHVDGLSRVGIQVDPPDGLGRTSAARRPLILRGNQERIRVGVDALHALDSNRSRGCGRKRRDLSPLPRTALVLLLDRDTHFQRAVAEIDDLVTGLESQLYTRRLLGHDLERRGIRRRQHRFDAHERAVLGLSFQEPASFE